MFITKKIQNSKYKESITRSYPSIDHQLHSNCPIAPSSGNQKTYTIARQTQKWWRQGPLGPVPLSGSSCVWLWGPVLVGSNPPVSLMVWCSTISSRWIVAKRGLVVECCSCASPASEISIFEIKCGTFCMETQGNNLSKCSLNFIQ